MTKMNKLTKDLLKIFRPEGEFRQGDVVKLWFTENGSHQGKYTIGKDTSLFRVQNNSGIKKTVLIEPMVTKDEVELALINNGFVYWTNLTVLTIKHAEEKIQFTVRTGIKSEDTFYWQLGKGLFQQERETQEAIYRILK